MVDYSVFDSILDAAFIVGPDGKVEYCNDAAAVFCGTSARRIMGKALLSDLIQIDEPGIFPFDAKSAGRDAPTPFIETGFKLTKDERVGRLQLAIRPMTEVTWAFFVRDVSLEEALHSKYRSELAQKEEYAKNLEKLVEERTLELRRVNQTLQAILNSLGQGFFTFDSTGACSDVFTRACEAMLAVTPKGQTAWKVLGVPDAELGTFKKWIDAVFQEMLPFEDMKALGPQTYEGDSNKYVPLEYYPIRDEANKIGSVVVVATDKTEERKAQLALEEERQYASMIIKYIKNKNQFTRFLAGVEETFPKLNQLVTRIDTQESVQESFRILHTIEGEAGIFSLRPLRLATRVSQGILEPFKGTGVNDPSALEEYKVSLETLRKEYDDFLKKNEGVIERSKSEQDRRIEVSMGQALEWIDDLSKVKGAETIKSKAEDIFLNVELKSLLSYYDSLVQSVSENLGKKVEPLLINDNEIRLPAGAYSDVFSSLVHAFRNAVDHGIETPDERLWAEKPEAGRISVTATLSDDGFSLLIEDNGRGIDPAVIREKLGEKFPDKDISALTDAEVVQAVAWTGFSSRTEVGEYSGRGVGLDALRAEVLKMKGTFNIESNVGIGTKIHLHLPHWNQIESVLRSA